MTFNLRAGVVVESIKRARNGAGEPSWAHVSGWAQFSSGVRTVSCVIAAHNAAPRLARLLPDLSDLLTEGGFPWEITCIDSASADQTTTLLSRWTEYPGFGWIRLALNYGEAAAVHTGLSHARGDAVILVNAATDVSIERVPHMIAKWNQGDEVVYDNTERSQFMLLDRRMVNLMLRAEADGCSTAAGAGSHLHRTC
ncbi:MAG: glycosyltransferase [Burkholderiales bacterium]